MQELSGKLEVTILMPCLNEAETIQTCIRKAGQSLVEIGVYGEVLVADNGSNDRSQELAVQAGARLIQVPEKGYGNALMGGIQAAEGKFVIIADADESYDFHETGKFVEKLRESYDLVQGCRLPSGGGKVLPNAMPFLHRWWGNPMFTLLARWWFGSRVHDIYCGFRGFRREWQQSLGQRCTGMEFATEMLIKASLSGARIAEVPITLHHDGRKAHSAHLKTFRDGWRTLRFFLMCTPRWTFLVPGFLLIVLGLLGYALALPGVRIHGVRLDAHTLLFASLAILCGFQSMLFYVFTKTFAGNMGLLPIDPKLDGFYRVVTLERGLLAAGVILVLGLTLLAFAVNEWRLARFGDLDYAHTMRLVIPGATLTALGVQTVFSGFFVSLLGLKYR